MSSTLGTDGEEVTGSALDGDEAISSSLDSFPSSLLEEVLVNLDAWSVCHCASVSRAFRKVRGKELVSQSLPPIETTWDGSCWETCIALQCTGSVLYP